MSPHCESVVRVTNSHSKRVLRVEGEMWQPVRPPKRGQDRTAFNAYMLVPGFSLAFHAATLRSSRTTVAAYRVAATEATRSDPAIVSAVDATVRAMRPEHGLQMARLRGTAQLCYWSRLAICDYRKRGVSRREIAIAFDCSHGTVANVLQGKGQGYNPLSGERRLTKTQQAPAGRWARHCDFATALHRSLLRTRLTQTPEGA